MCRSVSIKLAQNKTAFRVLIDYLKPKQKMKKKGVLERKFVSIILALTATIAILSSTSVPSSAKADVREITDMKLPVQYYDFEDSPIYISVKK